MDREEFKQKYFNLARLLAGYFKTDLMLEQFDEDITIAEYINNRFDEANLALKQAQEVLRLPVFPAKLISDLSDVKKTPQAMKKWLQIVVKKLETGIKELEKQL